MPIDPDEPEFVPKGPPKENKKKSNKKSEQNEPALFDTGDE
jgi:hypothetical protein